jgi:hypothetical protein
MKIKEKVIFYWTKVKAFYATIPPRIKKMLVLAGGMFALLFILLIVGLIVKSVSNRPVTKVVLPTPVVTTLPTPEELTNPTRYATDSAVLKLEQNLKDNENRLNGLDIKESNLYPPQLDFDIKF